MNWVGLDLNFTVIYINYKNQQNSIYDDWVESSR